MIYPILSIMIIAGLVLSCIGGGWIVAGFALWVTAWGITLFKNLNKRRT